MLLRALAGDAPRGTRRRRPLRAILIACIRVERPCSARRCALARWRCAARNAAAGAAHSASPQARHVPPCCARAAPADVRVGVRRVLTAAWPLQGGDSPRFATARAIPQWSPSLPVQSPRPPQQCSPAPVFAEPAARVCVAGVDGLLKRGVEGARCDGRARHAGAALPATNEHKPSRPRGGAGGADAGSGRPVRGRAVGCAAWRAARPCGRQRASRAGPVLGVS